MTIELKGDKKNGSADLVTATTQFGEDEDGNQKVEIYGERDRKSLTADERTDSTPAPDIDKDGVVREYEVALKHLGFGLFHVFLILVNGIALSPSSSPF